MCTVSYILLYCCFTYCVQALAIIQHSFVLLWSFDFYVSSLKLCVKKLIFSWMQNNSGSGCSWGFPCPRQNCCPQVVCKPYITDNIGQCGMKIERLKEWLSPETHMRDQRNTLHDTSTEVFWLSHNWKQTIEKGNTNVIFECWTLSSGWGSCAKLPPTLLLWQTIKTSVFSHA